MASAQRMQKIIPPGGGPLILAFSLREKELPSQLTSLVQTGIQRGGWAWVAGSRPGNDKKRNLIWRVQEHKNDLSKGFTGKYAAHMLVYYESCDSVESAPSAREAVEGMAEEVEVKVDRGDRSTMERIVR